jgi:hypothetical protein
MDPAHPFDRTYAEVSVSMYTHALEDESRLIAMFGVALSGSMTYGSGRSESSMVRERVEPCRRHARPSISSTLPFSSSRAGGRTVPPLPKRIEPSCLIVYGPCPWRRQDHVRIPWRLWTMVSSRKLLPAWSWTTS